MADQTKNKTIVLQSKLKLFGEGYNATWQETVLTLFADSTVEYEMAHNAKVVIKIAPTITATRSIRVNYPEVFVINTYPESQYSSGPMFSAADLKAAEEWIHKINQTRARVSYQAVHLHPLTSTTKSTDNPGGLQQTSILLPNSIKCNLCDKKASRGAVCEFCDGYVLCEACENFLKDISRRTVNSPNHEHLMTKFARANDPLFFNENYNGNYNCDQCKKDQSGEVYHCVTCEVYDECPSCAIGLKKPTSAIHALGNLIGDALSGSAPIKLTEASQSVTDSFSMHLEIKHLAPAMNVEGKTFALKSQAKIPMGSSMISDRPWNLLKIETEPVPQAYMEVTFNKFAPSSFVGVGIGNQIWVQNQMLGLQQNSYGYFNNGTISHNVNTQEASYFPGFEAGDTIGVGILFDSYQQRRLFFTKNGQMLGNFPAVIHKGMDCFPGVSFKNDSEVSFTVEMNGPFKFDVNSIPDYRSNKVNRISTVPTEIVADILLYVASSARLALELRLVNKSFSQVACDNLIWKRLFLAKWPMQNSKLKLKSWYTLYKRRTGAKPSGNTPSIGGGKSYIENCDFEFQCPLLWEEMNKGKTENERFCNKCQKTVYSVSDEATLRNYAEMGRCVSFVEKISFPQPSFPPRIQRLGGAPRPSPRPIPPPPK